MAGTQSATYDSLNKTKPNECGINAQRAVSLPMLQIVTCIEA